MTFRLLTITAALGLAASAATAQPTSWLGNAASFSATDYRAPYADARRGAYDNGYRDGVKRGEQAARDRRPFDVERERDYRGAEGGYNQSYGDRTRYRNDYRGGFAQGYRDGYSRGGNNGQYRDQYPDRYPSQSGIYPRDVRDGIGNRGYGGTAGYGAFQNGVADGYRKALEDQQDRKYPDATRHKWYRSGDHDYDRAYGSKDAYKIEYRRGFKDGYDRAFREGRR